MPTERIAARSSGSTQMRRWRRTGYSRRELRDIERMARANLELLRNEWDEFCSGYIS